MIDQECFFDTCAGRFRDDVREIDEFLAVLVNRLDPDAVPASEAHALWLAVDAIERRSGAAKTLLARRVRRLQNDHRYEWVKTKRAGR